MGDVSGVVRIAVAGRLGAFGSFGQTHVADPPPVTLLSVLAFAMGLQNAAVASTTGLAVRTTHLTGPATDLGIHLGVACISSGADRWEAMRGAALRGGKILAYLSGAGVAIPLTGSLGYLALLAPVSFVLIATALSFTTNWSASDYPIPDRRGPSEPST
ncbi:MAG TPA: YoaK family protein [Planctomycetaceae bacterium]|nr:YoaK family protein [Planctomycetaceae bacterium]